MVEVQTTMHRARRIPINDLNQHLICALCKGYFVDATTIVECLHTFCRSCIVKYLQSNKYCPVCDVQVHKNKPLLNIRPDRTIQDIVYKLVPRLYQNELQRRRAYYQTNLPDEKSNLERDWTQNYQHLLLPDETISITMHYYGCSASIRYLRCPAAVSVAHLQKLIKAKYDLTNNHHVDILYNQDCLNSSLTLMDIAYIYSWKKKNPLELTYRIYEYTMRKVEQNTTNPAESTNNNNNWKEVQLRISENGEMSITGIEELINNNNNVKCKSELVTVVSESNDRINNAHAESPVTPIVSTVPALAPPTTLMSKAVAQSSCANTKTVYSTINSMKCSVSTNSTSNKSTVKRKCSDDAQSTPKIPKKQAKQTILNHSIGLQNLSNNHPLKRHAQSKNVDNPSITTSSSVANNNIITSTVKSTATITTMSTSTIVTPKIPCYMPKSATLNVPKPAFPSKSEVTCAKSAVKSSETNNCKMAPPTTTMTNQMKMGAVTSVASPTPPTNNRSSGKSRAGTPIGYKTLRDPPKSWNSQLSKLNKPSPEGGRSARPAKFFKMRNNMPRYLGNPASGVKPMYQVQHAGSPEKDKDNKDVKDIKDTNDIKEKETKSSGSEIKKHSIVKIDPKTLKPISERAPETSSLSGSSNDLKINISSVSIFNPLKLQSSPKSDRKSPKSPHSPKVKNSTSITAAPSTISATTTTTTTTSSPSIKRDKLSLNFTPSNPFIPNLASPTVSPNQFLYPSGPTGFPSYDPRVMAAYHSLFYGNRMGFPGLSLDLNQRAAAAHAQSHSPQPSPKIIQTPPVLTNADQSKAKSSSSSLLSSKPPVKKSGKDQLKTEKSLKVAVEKLTQNRVKEIINKSNETASKNVNKNKHFTSKDDKVEKKKVEEKIASSSKEDSPIINNKKKETKSQLTEKENEKKIVKEKESEIDKKDGDVVDLNKSNEGKKVAVEESGRAQSDVKVTTAAPALDGATNDKK